MVEESHLRVQMRHTGMLQYLTVSGVTNVFTRVTPQVQAFISDHLKAICHRGGPYCGGTPDELHTPVAAIHVRGWWEG